jgi:ribosomal-protein-alanine N-acetyltransferase
MKPQDFAIRMMYPDDLPGVMSVELQCFDDPWDEQEFREQLRKGHCFGSVATVRLQIVGYMVYELLAGEVNVLSVAVSHDHRRCGIAGDLVRKQFERLTPKYRNRIVANVRETNLAGQLFFKSLRFRAVRVLSNFYDEIGEDAYRMVRMYESVQRDLAAGQAIKREASHENR